MAFCAFKTNWHGANIYERLSMRHIANTTTKLICGGFIAGLVAAAPLKAQDFRYGAQVSVVNPMGDLSDISRTGFGAAFLVEMGLAPNMAIRGKADYLIFGEKTHGQDFKTSASLFSVMADCIYSFDTLDHGFFGVVGISSLNATAKLSGILEEGEGHSTVTNSESGLGFSVGAGYNINRNMGVEVKYNKGLGDKQKRWEWIQASFTYRF
jgi:opacity protein-like surface antigen